MPFSHPLQLAFAFVLAAALTLRGWDRGRAAFAAGRLSFILGVAWIIAGGWKRWYPQGDAIAAVATWALTGWLAGVLAWTIIASIRSRVLPARSASAGKTDASV